MTKQLIIELHDFDAVTFTNILRYVYPRVQGESDDWTSEYQKVLKKVLEQVWKQMGFKGDWDSA